MLFKQKKKNFKQVKLIIYTIPGKRSFEATTKIKTYLGNKVQKKLKIGSFDQIEEEKKGVSLHCSIH